MATKETIRQFIGAQLLSDQGDLVFSDHDSLIDSGVIDSFGIMALLGFVEEKFSIKVGSDDLLPENFDSINSISTLVDRIVGSRAEV